MSAKRANPTVRAAMTGDEVAVAARALVERTFAAQGLPRQVTDPATIQRVATLIAEPRREEAATRRNLLAEDES